MSGGSAQLSDSSHSAVPPPRGGQGSPGCGDHIQGVHPLRPEHWPPQCTAHPDPENETAILAAPGGVLNGKSALTSGPGAHSSPTTQRASKEGDGARGPRPAPVPLRSCAGSGGGGGKHLLTPTQKTRQKAGGGGEWVGTKITLLGLEAEPLLCVNSSSPGVTLSAQTADLHRLEFPGQRPVCMRRLTAPQTGSGL